MSIWFDLAELAPFVMIFFGLVAIWSGFIRFFKARDESLADKWARNVLFLILGIIVWIPCWISYLVYLFTDEGNPNDLTAYVLLSLLGWAFVAHFLRDLPGSLIVGSFLFILLSAIVITIAVVFDDINTDDMSLKLDIFDSTMDIPILMLVAVVVGIPIIATILYYFFIEAPVDFVLTIFILLEGPIGILNIIQGIALLFWDNGVFHFIG
ncbi:MAG: hypothetical protein ACFFCQ_06760 [Promethearchaeota archaeon]